MCGVQAGGGDRAAVADRWPAIRAYGEGEALCDAGRAAEGTRQMRAAYALAPELDGAAWPEWAEVMYAAGAPPVPLLARDTSSLQPELSHAAAACGGGDGWLGADALASVAAALVARHIAVLDGFLDDASTASLRGACAEAYSAGHMHPPTAPSASRQGGRRQGGDQISWVDDVARWPALRELATRADALVRALGEMGAGLGLAVPVGSRLRPMVSRYSRGAAFSRHVDAHAGDGRCLSAVFYTTAEWAEADGGCLRVYRPPAAEGDDDAVADVAPLGGRLVLFHADERCPHEVLPVRSDAERYAATLWYLQRRAGPAAPG